MKAPPPLLAHVRLPPTVSLAKQWCSRDNAYAGQFGGLEARNIVQAISETNEASEPLGKDLDALGLQGAMGGYVGRFCSSHIHNRVVEVVLVDDDNTHSLSAKCCCLLHLSPIAGKGPTRIAICSYDKIVQLC